MAKGGQIRYQVGFDIQQQNLNKLKTALQDLQKMNVKDVVKINETDISSARTMLDSIKKDASKVEQALEKAFNVKLNTVNVNTFNQALKQSGTSIENVYRSFSQAGAAGEAAFRNLSTQLLSTNIQLKESHKLLDKMGQTLANTVKWNIASSAINAISRSAEQAWGFVKALDTSLNDIRIVTGKSADEMADFAIKANDAAQSLGKSTTDYTNAALIYAQQGLSDKEVEERAKITLKAANVTGQSTSDVSEELTAVWNGYKVTAKQAELYVDRLAAVAATTASDLEELSTGMSKVASAAAAMGVSEEQLAAQLSTIISATRQAPESVGTALRTVYARISDIKAGIDQDGVTLGNYSGKMADLGFNVLDAAGNLRDMGEVMEEIGGRWQNLTREQQVNLAQTMAGQRQYNNLLALFDNFEKYNESLNVAQNAAGTLQKQQDIYMESTASHLQALNAAVEKIYNSLADTDSINKIIDVLKDAANLVGTFVDSIGGGVGVLRALGSIGITVFSKQIGSSIQTTINNFERAKTQAQLFEDAIAEANELNDKGLGNDYTRFLNKEGQSLLQMGGKLSTEDFGAIQKNLQQLSQNASQIEIVQEKINLLKKDFNSLGLSLDATAAKWGTLDDMLGSANGVEEVKTQLEALKKKFDPIIEKKDKVSEAFNTMFKDVEKHSSNAENSFNIFKEQLGGFVNTLQTIKIDEKTGQKLFETLPQYSRKSIEQAQAELQKLDFSNPDAVGQITKLYRDINGVITQEIQKIQNLIQDADDGKLEGLQAKLKALQATQQKIKAEQKRLKEKAQKFIDTQDMTKTIGSIAQIGTSIQQIQNLGSIWKNADLTGSQKLLQIITNLGTSLPMVIIGFENLKETLDLSKAVTGWLGAITAAVTVIGMVVSAQKEARQAIIKNNDAIIEKENKKQEQIETNRKLIQSLRELDKQYKNGEIARIDLKSAVEDLIDQYGLEGAAADKLSKNYGNLINYMKEARREMAQTGYKSADQEVNAARDNITKQAAKSDAGQQIGTNYLLTINGSRFEEGSNEIAHVLQQQFGGFFGRNNEVVFRTSFDTDSIVDQYNLLVKAKSAMQGLVDQEKITEAQLQSNSYYQNLTEYLTQMQPYVDKLTAGIKDLNKYSVELAAIDVFDAYNINNINDFISAKDALIEAIKDTETIQTNDPVALADAYIRENYRTLYTEFSDYSTIVDKFKDKFGEDGKKDQEIIDDIVKQMSELDPGRMGQLMDMIQLHPQIINNWEQLLNIVKQFTELAPSNVTIGSSLQDATAQYNKYQSVEDAVRSGKTISAETYGQLNPEIQDFFNITVDGTYKMVGIAKDFQTAVDNIKFQKFENRIKSIDQQLQHWNNINENGSLNNFDDSIIDSVWTDELKRWLNQQRNDQGDSDSRVKELLDAATAQAYQQLDYLRTVATPGSELAKILIPRWEAALKNGLTEPLATAIADAVQENQYKDKTAELQDDRYLTGLTMASSVQSIQELKELRDIIGDQAFNQAAINLDNALDTKNLDPEELEEYSKYLQRVADNVEILDDELDNHDDAAKDVAKSIMKMNDGLEILSNNWENWSDVLTNSTEESEEYHKAMDGTREAVANLLDISEEYVRDSFIKQHLDDITDAANGSETAINELKAALLEDIVQKIVLENHIPDEGEQLKADIAALQAAIPSDLKVGTKLETKSFLDAANNLIKNSKLTVDQVNAIFDDLGFETHFKTTKKKVKQTVPKIVTYTKAEDLGEFDGRKLTRTETVSYQNGSSTFYGQMDVPAMSTNDDVPAIDFVTAKADSDFSDFSSINTGGNTGGSGGRSSGGGSSKSSSPDTSKKDTKNPAKDTRDIYHDINIELKQIEREIDRVQEKQDRLYGKELLDNLNKQQELLEKHKNTLAEKQKLQEWDLQNQRETLENLNVTFDAYGNISNYMDILGQKQAAVNAKTKEYNDLVSQYNALTDKDAKKQLADQMEAVNKQLKAAEDDYKNLQDKIKSYDGLREDMEDLVDQVEEETQKQIEIEIEKFRMELEIRLDLGQAQRDWNKFRREVLEHTNILSDSDFDKIYNDARLNTNDVTSYFNIGGSGTGSIEKLTNQLLATKAALEDIDETGKSAIYGDNKAQAMEDLQNDLDELMGQMEDIESLIDDIDEAYLDTIDDIDKNFDKQIEDYEFIGDLIEHDIDLLTLLYGEENYNAMERYYNTLQENNLKQLDSLRKQRDFWKEQWDAAVARGDSQAAKEFEKNYKDTLKNLNGLIEESAKTLQSKYENAINGIFDALDKKISGGMGTDYAEMEWNLMQKNADEYLDIINSVFAIQDIQGKYQDAIDSTKSIKQQQTLKKLMDEQLGILRTKEKITEYDVQRAEKLLQVEQARIALEDARAAKTALRLKRDSQGNYTYEYMADVDAIGDAVSQLAAAQQELYNFDKEAYKKNLSDMLSAWKDFQSEYKQIMLDTSLSDEERIAKLQLLQDEYGEYINGKTEENNQIRGNLMDSAFDALATLYEQDAQNYKIQLDNETGIVETSADEKSGIMAGLFGDLARLYEEDPGKFQNMTDKEKDILMNDLVPEWDKGIQQMSDTFAGQDGFIPTCEDAFDDLSLATEDYQNDLDNLAFAADTDLAQVKEGIDKIAESLSAVVETNDELLNRMQGEMEAISNLRTEILSLVGAYNEVYDAAQKAVEAVYEYRQVQQLDAAQAAAEASQKAADIAKEAAATAQKAIDSIKENNAASTEKPDTMSEYERLIEGLAGSVWTGSWSSGEERVRRMVETYGQEKGQKIYNAVQNKINEGFGYDEAGKAHDWDYYKQFDYKPKNNTTTKSNNTATSSYSGGTSGNTSQTGSSSTIGNTKIPRSALTPIVTAATTASVQAGATSALKGLNNIGSAVSNSQRIVEQSVHIEANFHGEASAQGVEKALTNLVNNAAQRANKNYRSADKNKVQMFN